MNKKKQKDLVKKDQSEQGVDTKVVSDVEILDGDILDDKDFDNDKDLEDIVYDNISSNDDDDLIENLPVLDNKFLPKVVSRSSNELAQYIKEVNRYELLTREEELALAKELKETGDIEIAKRLVVSNLRLVVKIAMEYRYAYTNMLDLIQEGNIGLMKAVSMYDPEKGAKLSYYASWWIKSYILKFILDNFRLVKVGTTNEQKKLFYNLMREKDKLKAQGISPDHKTIAKNLNVSEKAVALMDQRLGENSSDLSIDYQVSDGSTNSFGDFLSIDDDFTEKVSYNQSLQLLQENLDEFVGGLKERDRKIFTERLLSDAPRSLQAIADDYCVSRERIRQIESRLLENLKLYMRKHIR